MDYQEFEEHIADYVEGRCAGELHQRMEEARRQDPACDRLARLHEEILSALQQTPELKAPAGLSERILAAVSAEEALLEQERQSLKDYLLSWLAPAAAASAAFAGVLFVYRDNLARLAQAALAAGRTAQAWLAAQGGELALKGGAKVSESNQTLDSWLKIENSYLESASAAVLQWLKSSSAVINYPVGLPGVDFTLPAFYLVSAGLLAAFLWYCRDDLAPASYSAAKSARW